MGSEMQEKIAKAIEEASKDCDDPAVYYQVVALAAMEAMREPTSPMLDAGVAYALNVTLERAGGWSEYIRVKHRNMLAAEIEAAKKGL